MAIQDKSQDSDKSYSKMEHSELRNLTVQTVVAEPVQFKVLYCSAHGMISLFFSSIAIQVLWAHDATLL